MSKRRPGLTQLPATALCGNDITSSCLYVSALAIVYSGRWAPLALAIVAIVLYLYRRIYAEVVGALPLNGGAYNALLNTTSKFRASIAACLTILSYMATAVISASEAMHYVATLWPGFPVTSATVGLLAAFMGLTILGITESAVVATVIFLAHLATLGLLLLVGLLYVFAHGSSVLATNLSTPTDVGPLTALFFGFAAAMLGISGFESSANFVEEQAPGVFPKTLRNMWIAVTVINPVMALLALALIPMANAMGHQEALLAHLGEVSGGAWLSTVISIDAALVLSGAVLTSYIGVNGLVRRMTLDRCLPQFLLRANRFGVTHRIIIAFFALTVSILLITGGELKALAGVYTLSFLAVMGLFALGNILLKFRRARMPRPASASLPAVLAGLVAVIIGLVGNAVMNPPYVVVFLEYFIPSLAIVAVMLGRIALLRAFVLILRAVIARMTKTTKRLSVQVNGMIDRINAQQVVFFTRGDNLANLNNAILYVRRNEHTNRVKVVNVIGESEAPPPRLQQDLEFLDEAYPEIDIEFVVVEGSFGPKLISGLAARWKIAPNFMFIGSPGDHMPFDMAELGGVRLII